LGHSHDGGRFLSRKAARAEFLGAALKPAQMPPEGTPEVAFAGRSNVGKSSLINTITGIKIAHISAVPGKTRTINFYAVGKLRLVDLPGYGYAAVPHAMRRLWQPAVEEYLAHRKTLRGVLLVVDARRGLQDEEHDLLAWLIHHGLPHAVVLTKTDKLKAGALAKARQEVAAGIAAEPVIFSARTGSGREIVWKVIRQLAQGGPEAEEAGEVDGDDDGGSVSE